MIRSTSPASDDSLGTSGLSRLPPDTDFSTAGWRPLRRIAVTASSEIFLLQDSQGRLAAGKRLAPTLTGHRRLLEHEYHALTRFADAAVVRVLGLTTHKSEAWLLLEYLNYGDLRSLAGSPPAFWLPLMLEPVRWLADLHAQGFVHGDMKTSHIMLRRPNHACCIDLATVTACGQPTPMQTPAALPPEGAVLASPSADVYALGVMLHELLFGRLPGAGRQARDAESPGGPQLAVLAGACCATRPADRPTMQAVFGQLSELTGRAALAVS